MVTLEELTQALIQAWTPRTDIPLPDNLFVSNEPATGQCAVTSLVVQDYLGGEILNTVVTAKDAPETTSSHYFNLIDDESLDLTRQQFQEDAIYSESKQKTEGFNSTREYILSYPSTVERYELLKQNVKEHLSNFTDK